MNLHSFGECIKKVPDNPHILLGNGFSRAWNNEIFSYDALYDQAKRNESIGDELNTLFEALGTTDFEQVIRLLNNAGTVFDVYGINGELKGRLQSDVEQLKQSLVSTIAGNHPEAPYELSDDEIKKCKIFLSHFGKIYTTNYDLLLYWVIMNDEIEPKLQFKDGFSQGDIEGADYVVMDPNDTHGINLNYLHGALHLFDAGSELRKYTWIRTGERLIEQTRKALDKGLYPLFVSEGEANQKLSRIRHSYYLSKVERSLGSRNTRTPLFFYGFAFSDNDDHIIDMLKKNSISKMYVSIYGDPESKPNKQIENKINDLIQSRGRRKLEVEYYDAESAHIWR